MTEPPFCRTADSGWSADRDGPGAGFEMRGRDLAVDLRRWRKDECLDLADGAALGEELGAVLQGRFELVCGEERHEVAAGNGILVPLGHARRWRSLGDDGVLYRVTGPVSPAR